MEQLSRDTFGKQVGHGMSLTLELRNNPSGDSNFYLQKAIQAQLSHSDGIREVSYLTADESPADQPEIPQALMEALQAQMKSEAVNELVSLTCMNVIKPTAMITMHQDPELSASSARTARRGVRILKALCDYPAVVQNAKAILQVAQGTRSQDDIEQMDSKLIKYWTEKWGYKERQRADIAKTMKDLLG